MKILTGTQSELFVSDENILEEFRLRNAMIIGWASVPFLLPFTINNFIQARYLLGVLTTLVTVIALLNSFLIKKHQRRLIPSWCFLLCIFSTILYAMTSVGVNTLYWYYPIFFVVYFLSDRFSARIQILCAFSVLIPYSFYLFDTEVAIRFLCTLSALCFFSDILIGVQTQLQNRMAELIIRDPLTNAFNRRHMNSSIQIVIEEIKRGLNSASLLWLDIDHFKMVNDQFGHEAGDQVLIKLVNLLHKRQRQVDYVFRAGGEEFVILLKNTELKQALLLAEDLRKHVAEAAWPEEQKITISIGVAQYKLSESSDEWLKRADDNMYEAKNLGRNRVCPIINEID